MQGDVGERLSVGGELLPAGAARTRGRDRRLSRVHALLKRRSERLRFRGLELDTRGRTAKRGKRAIELTPTEYSLLELFLRHPGRVLTRRDIHTQVWGFDFGSSSNALNVHIGCLRRKTEARGEPRLIHTVRGVGYVLREP
jgi:two-component system response regulator MprA